MKLLRKFLKEVGKYLANEVSCIDFFGGNFHMQSSAEDLHYVFDIGDHPIVLTCLPTAAESFK